MNEKDRAKLLEALQDSGTPVITEVSGAFRNVTTAEDFVLPNSSQPLHPSFSSNAVKSPLYCSDIGHSRQEKALCIVNRILARP